MKTPEKGHCGDGICDEEEKKNPALCPEDCSPIVIAATPTPPPSEGERWSGEMEWTHDVIVSRPACPAHLSAHISFCFQVSPSGGISGSGGGSYTEVTSTLSGCTLETPDFNVYISGHKEENSFELTLETDAKEKFHYKGTTQETKALIIAMFHAGGLNFTIPAEDGARKEFNATYGNSSLKASGWVQIHKGCE